MDTDPFHMDLFCCIHFSLANLESSSSGIASSNHVEFIKHHGSETSQDESYDPFIGHWDLWHAGQWHSFYDVFDADS